MSALRAARRSRSCWSWVSSGCWSSHWSKVAESYLKPHDCVASGEGRDDGGGVPSPPGARHWVLAPLCLFQRRLGAVEKRIVEILADPAVDIRDEVRGYLALLGDHLQQDAGRRHIETRIGQLDRAEGVYHHGLRFGVVHLFGYQFRSFLLGIRLDEVDPAQCRSHEANDQIGVVLGNRW